MLFSQTSPPSATKNFIIPIILRKTTTWVSSMKRMTSSRIPFFYCATTARKGHVMWLAWAGPIYIVMLRLNMAR